VQDEGFADAVGAERGHNGWDIAVCACVIVAVEPDGHGYAEVVVQEKN
jgi:hypothetical protein